MFLEFYGRACRSKAKLLVKPGRRGALENPDLYSERIKVSNHKQRTHNLLQYSYHIDNM